MAATFRTRPWQLALLARPAFAPVLNNITPGLLAHSQQIRHAASKSRRLPPAFRISMKQTQRQHDLQEATSSLSSSMIKEQAAVSTAEAAVLAPRTLVPLPLSKTTALGGSQWLRYYREILVQRVIDRVQILQQAWRLKPKFFSRATFRADRKGVVNAALDLHADMSRCLATGDEESKQRLAKICVPKLQRSLVAAITSRPHGRTYLWERVKLTGSPFWPRLVDHKWMDIDVGYNQSFRQAVVGIKSQQTLTELDAKGDVVKTKEMEVLEYLVLWKVMDKVNLTQGDWQIYGTLKETTFAELMEEKERMNKMSDMMADQKIRESKKKLAEQ